MVEVTQVHMRAAAYYCLAISILGSAANLWVLLCVAKSRSLNAGMKVVLLNAFLPSFLFSCVVMPFFFKLFLPPFPCEEDQEQTNETAELNFCSKLHRPNLFFGTVCVLIMMELTGLYLVSFYRYLAISSPSHYYTWIRAPRASILCIINWSSSFLIWGLIWGLKLVSFDTERCRFESKQSLAQRITISAIYFLPLVATIILLLATQKKIQIQDKKTEAIRSSNHSLYEMKISTEVVDTTNTNSASPSNSRSCESKKYKLKYGANLKKNSDEGRTNSPGRRNSFYKRSLDIVNKYYSIRSSPVRREAKRFLKITNRIWIILFVFCFTNIPHVAVHMFDVTDDHVFVFVLLHLFQWVHLVLDPVIYLVLNKRDVSHAFSSLCLGLRCTTCCSCEHEVNN